MTSRGALFTKFYKDYNQQLECPLYTRIPAELRNQIFALALLRYDLEPLAIDTYCTRPGYMHNKRIDTNLLATCRRIYLETHLVPVHINEHVFWCFRGPPNSSSDPGSYFSRLTYHQLRATARAHFFTQLYWLEGTFPSVCGLQSLRYLTHIKITVRQSDWWFWENNNRLRMKSEWTRNLKTLESLEELEVELECIDRDKDQLDAIAATMATWQFDLQGKRVLSTAGSDIVCSRWVGPSSFHGIYNYDKYKKLWQNRLPVLQQEPGLSYYVLALTWRAISADVATQ